MGRKACRLWQGYSTSLDESRYFILKATNLQHERLNSLAEADCFLRPTPSDVQPDVVFADFFIAQRGTVAAPGRLRYTCKFAGCYLGEGINNVAE